MKNMIGLYCVPLALFASCGGSGGGGSGAITGLSAPGQMDIVTVQGTQSTPVPDADGVPAFALGSHYMTDRSSVHVYDPAIEPVQLVNEILCYIAQTGADLMVNRGPYNAQIDESKCQDGADPAGDSSGQSSGANAGAPDLWVVDSARPDNASPQTVHVWVPEDEEGMDSTIYVDMTVTAEPTDANPFGAFECDFAGAEDLSGLAMPLIRGALQTAGSGLGFELFFEHGNVDVLPDIDDGSERVAVRVAMSDGQSTGQARVLRSYRRNDPMMGDSGIQTEEYLLDFDENEVLRELVGGPTISLSRTDYRTNTFRYNLYHAEGPDAGQRVEVESGFSIRTAGGINGWLGYWGLWLPEGVEIASGDTVERAEYGSSTTEEYTLVLAPGKLIQYVKNALTLAEAEGSSFDWWDGSSSPSSSYQVQLSGGLFEKVAVWDEISESWMALGAPEVIDTLALGFLNMYSPMLGGPVGYVHGETSLTYFATAFVNGSSDVFDSAVGGAVELHGFVQCLRSDLTAIEAEAGDIFLPDVPDVSTPHVFQFQRDDLTLYHDSDGMGTLTRVGLADGEVPTSGANVWGLRSGPLFTDASALVNPWEVWNQDSFYVYETGPNTWNRYAAARDVMGDDVVFDPPLQFTYVHSTANDANGDSSWDGARVFLSYGGTGNLWGIPFVGFDFDTDGNEDRFYPSFSLADGTLLGPTGTEYVLRGIESELTLATVVGGGAGLDTARAAALVLPDASIYDMPDIGPKPVVTDPPAVIEGVQQ